MSSISSVIVVVEEPGAIEPRRPSVPKEPKYMFPDGRNRHDCRRSASPAEEQQYVAHLVTSSPLDPPPCLLQRHERRQCARAKDRILPEAPQEPGDAGLPLRSLPCGEAGGYGRD